MAANCASDMSAAAAPLTLPRNSGGVSPCNMTADARTATAAPSPMPADPISAAAWVGAAAIKKIDAPTIAMPHPINFLGLRRADAALLRTAEPVTVPAAISMPMIPSSDGPRSKTSRTYTGAIAAKHPAAKVPAAIDVTTNEKRASANRKPKPVPRSRNAKRGGNRSAGRS